MSEKRVTAGREKRSPSVFWMSVAGLVVALVAAAALISRQGSHTDAASASASAKSALPGHAGAPCARQSWACSADGKSELHCKGGRFVVAETCKGPNGCTIVDNGDRVHCDYTLAELHDPCEGKDYTCSTDHQAVLKCDASRWAMASTCRGPKGCRMSEADAGSSVLCDSFIAKAGDPCNRNNGLACSTEHDAVLRCSKGQFKLMVMCRGPKGCKMKHVHAANATSILCDTNIAKVGDACMKGATACQPDKKVLLDCSADGHFQLDKTCPRGCDAKPEHPACVGEEARSAKPAKAGPVQQRMP